MIENAKIQFFYYKKSYFCSMNNKRIFEMRRFIKRLMFALVLLCGSQSVFSQVDTAFWFAVPKLAHGHPGHPIKLCVSTLDSPATVTVTKPAAGNATIANFTVPANSSYSHTLVSDEAGLTGFECDYNTPVNYGLYIHSTAKVNAYIAVQNNNSEIYALKGNNALGTQFFIPMQYQYENASYNGQARNSVQIIATENNTTVTIIPSVSLYQDASHPANTPFNVTLNKGQVYNIASSTQTATGHMAGTVISSDKPIVVDVSDDSATPNGSNQDLVADQIVPEELAGSEYIVIPSPSAANNTISGSGLSDYAFIFALEDNTKVTVYYNNGTLQSQSFENLMRGDKRSFHFPNNNPAFIWGRQENEDGTTTPKPIFVFQVTGAGNELGGTQLPHVYCTGSTSAAYMPLAHPQGSSHVKHLFLTLICKEEYTTGFQINGVASIAASEWQTVPGHTMKYCRKDISSMATQSSIRVTNSLGKFHMGVIDYHQPGGYDDCSISYFSSYTSGSSIAWNPIVTHSDYCQGDTIIFDFDSVDASITRILGPNNYEISSEPFLLADVNSANSGWYTVVAGDSRGCLLEAMIDSIEITVHPTVESVLYDTVCPGASYVQNGFQIPSDSTAVPHTIVDTVVTQTVEFGCDSLLILELTVRDSVFGEFSKKACNQYTWNGQTYRTSGDYQQSLEDVHGCDSLVTLHLEIEDPSVEIVASGDDFCEYGELVLTAVSDYQEYHWSTGDTTSFISVSMPQTLYTVTVTQGDCQASAKYETPDCPLNIFIPSAITPSQTDGKNDFLSLPEYVHRFISKFDIEIFNRWGDLVFKSSDMNFRWAGDGVNLSQVYYYVIRIWNLEGKPFVYKGTVTVL